MTFDLTNRKVFNLASQWLRTWVALIGLVLVGILSALLSQLWSSPRGEDPITYSSALQMRNFERVGYLGYGGIVSSLAWVQAVFMYADMAFDGSRGAALPGMLSLVVSSDPTWEYPYEFAGLTLERPEGGISDAGLDILERGVFHRPASWRIRLYLAMALQERGRKSEASKVMKDLVVTDARIPQFVRELAVSLVNDADGPKLTGSIILTKLRSSKDPLIVESLREKLESILSQTSSVDSVLLHHALGVLTSGLHLADQEEAESISALLQGVLEGDSVSIRTMEALGSDVRAHSKFAATSKSRS